MPSDHQTSCAAHDSRGAAPNRAYDYIGGCKPAPDKCLTVEYWNWGPVYLDIIKQVRAGTWKPGNSYLDADSGIVGLYGFMSGQTP